MTSKEAGPMRRLMALTAVTVLAVAGCESVTEPGAPIAPDGLEPVGALSSGNYTAAHGVYFLPPMAPSAAYAGTFDAGLSPVVEVCGDAACEEPHVRFSMTDGAGSEVIRVDEEGEHYIVNWSTLATVAAAGEAFAVRVRVGEVQLAEAPVVIVQTAREAVSIGRDGVIALVAGQTLPIKVRIETGIPGAVVVTPAEAEMAVGGAQAFTASLLDLRGEPLQGPAVTWSPSNAGVATVNNDGLANGVSLDSPPSRSFGSIQFVHPVKAALPYGSGLPGASSLAGPVLPHPRRVPDRRSIGPDGGKNV